MSITPGDTQLSVAFTAGSDGGSAITDYKYSTNGGSSFTSAASTTSPIVITGLTNGTSYNVQIKAVNTIGDGTATASTAATPGVPPSAPTITAITPGNGQLSVAFTAGASGGPAITNYKYSTNGGSTFTSAGTTTSPITITGLANGTSYDVQIRAVNAAGDGTPTASTVATPRTTPSAPTGVVITPGNAQLSVAFTAGSDGGSAITDYKYSTNGGSSFTSAGTITSPIVITGLTNGTSYNVQIRAVNAAGDGTATSSTAATPRTTPSAPTITAITPGNAQLSVAFTAGANGGSGLTNYKYSTDGGSSFTAVSPAAVTSPILITGLTNGVSYDVQILAVNAAGDGAPSTTTTATPAIPPAIAASPSALTGLNYFFGSGPSTSQSFNISGSNLTGAPGDVTVTGSTNYEVSSDNTTFGNIATVAFASATLSSTPVYVRLKAGLAVASYNAQTISMAGGGASQNVTVSGSVTLANDLSSNATVLTVNAAAVTGTMVGATVTSPFTGNGDVWYQFTPAVSGTATVTTANNGQDLDLTVWSTSPPASNSGSAASSTASGTISETVSLSVTSGVPYYIRVLRFSGTAAIFTIGVTNIEPAPTLTAAVGATVDNAFNVTFTDNPTWRAAITSITVGGTTLDPAAYSTSSPSQITFTPSASTLLQSSGSKAIVVIATGYANAPVTQSIVAGAATKLAITTQPTAPVANGGVMTAQPVARIQDQYSNTTNSTANVVAAVGAGSWTLGGTNTRAGVAGTATFTDLTATSAAAVTGATITFTSGTLTGVTSTGFNIPAPVADFITLEAIGTPATENFDSMLATTTLPGGWKMGDRTSSPTWASASTSVTEQASSGTPSTGGTYNWGSTVSERAVGAMTSGGFASPNQLLVKVRNNTGSVLSVFSLDYKAERYRINSAAASVSFFYSLDGTAWTSVSAGDISASSFPTGTSAYNFSSGTSVSKTGVTQAGLSVANGSFLYLRWNIATVGGNSQGIGIDDVSITALGAPSVTTGAASAVAQTTATLAGNITATGGGNATERGVYVSTTDGFADGTGTKFSATGSFGAGTYSTNATGLTAATIYYFKAFAVNAAGTSYGSQGTFTTPALLGQTITFGTLTDRTFGDSTFSLTGSSDSGLSLSYTSSNESVATISGSTVTIVGAGSTTITANQAGNGTYSPAASVAQALTVNKADQTITFTLSSPVAVSAGSVALNGTASSGLAVSYTSSSPATAGISGSTLNLNLAGTVTVTASQAGNANYNPAASVDRALIITGYLAGADTVTRQPNSTAFKIPVATLLANDGQVLSNGSTSTTGLSITSVTAGTGNTVSVSGAFVFYTPTTPADGTARTFTYTLNGTATGTVTVNTVAVPFDLEMIRVVSGPTYINPNTSVTVEFAGVPGQSYNFQYTTNYSLGPWVTHGAVSTGSTGTFNVTFTAPGNLASAWGTLFFRATR